MKKSKRIFEDLDIWTGEDRVEDEVNVIKTKTDENSDPQNGVLSKKLKDGENPNYPRIKFQTIDSVEDVTNCSIK